MNPYCAPRLLYFWIARHNVFAVLCSHKPGNLAMTGLNTLNREGSVR